MHGSFPAMLRYLHDHDFVSRVKRRVTQKPQEDVIGKYLLCLVESTENILTCKGSFPITAKANSQARCENFHPITIFESTRCELASWLCDVWKRGLTGVKLLSYINCILLVICLWNLAILAVKGCVINILT